MPFATPAHTLALIAFWLLMAAIAWCYLGYPLYVLAIARLRPRPLRTQAGGELPSVTVVLAARNESRTLARRIENILAQEYPTELLDVLVACNGSADGTDEIGRDIARREPRVRVLITPAEAGKSGAINAAIADATGEVIVFTDARQLFAPGAIARLVHPLGDESVGAVTGLLRVARAEQASVKGVGTYWGLETRLRIAESRSGSVVGATGAIYAARRTLLPPMPPNLILDDVYLPMRIAMRGYRVVMATDAVAIDVPAASQGAEFARKRRTMVGNLQLLRVLPDLLRPRRNPLFLRYVSHKLLRVLTPPCVAGLLLCSALLTGWVYTAVLTIGLAVLLLGGIGLAANVRRLSLPAAFVLVLGATASALWRWRDDASHVWHPVAPGPAPRPDATSPLITPHAPVPALAGRSAPDGPGVEMESSRV